MKEKTFISVIIPVYNAEKYLIDCIDSILEQSYHEFELLLINDGSSDGSASICDEYALRDPRVQVFHKSNGGVSSARNYGVQEAQGDWITFVDSDDFVEHDFLQSFRDRITNEDLYICNAYKFSDKKRGIFYSLQSNSFDTGSFLQKYGLLLLDTPWAKFFKRSILIMNDLKFDECLHLGEDSLFNIMYVRYCDKVCVNEKAYYYYRLSENNLSRQSYSFEEEMSLLKVIKEEYGRLIEAKGHFDDKMNIARLFAAIYRNNDYPRKRRIQMLKEVKDIFPKQIGCVFRLKFGYGMILHVLLKCDLFGIFDSLYVSILNAKFAR